MNIERIQRAVNIINYAIENKLSLKQASIKNGYSDTYVKNIKAVVFEQYESGVLSDEDFNLFNEPYTKYLQIKGDKSETIGDETTTINEITEFSLIPKKNDQIIVYNSGSNELKVEWKNNYPDGHIKTLDELLKSCDVDLDVWGVKHYVINKWDVTSWRKSDPQTIQNFQVKATLEKNVEKAREIAIGEIFKDMIKNYQPPINHSTGKLFDPYENIRRENNLFEITLFDLHIGKLAWGGETGENYDTKIARERYLKTIETLIERAKGFEYSRIVFPIGSDFFNSDTIYNTTTKGTPQDEDLRWQKTFQVGTRLLIDAISMLKGTGVPIDVVVIPGNHDFERSYYMGEFLVAWFNNDNQVFINNGASPRKYYRFGNVLIGYTHGSEEKENALPLLMASDIESKPLWSETTYHEWHVGHIHRKRDMKYISFDANRMTNEDLGVTVRYLSSLTGTEEWHHKKGFVGATKAGEAFIWNDRSGMIAHLNANLIIE